VNIRVGQMATVSLGLLLLAIAACSVEQPVPQTAICEGGVCQAHEYRIGSGDVLQISVWKDESLNRIVPVRPDGMISLPLVNDVQAAGLTPMQLREMLTEKLKQYMPVPEVSVAVTEVHSFAVSVLGQVKSPGRYELKDEATILDVLAAAGGLTDFASPSRIVILRSDGDSKKKLTFDYNRAVSGSGEQKSFFVQPGDIVLVP
jgi:polysaccharide export outer membrane protein